jgi:hypothetical protein
MEIHEIFNELRKMNNGEDKAKVLLDNDSLALRTLMRLNFDKNIKLNVSKDIEYRAAARHDVISTLAKETRNYARLTDLSLSREMSDNRFRTILESLDPKEAKILFAAMNKDLRMRGLSKKLAIEVWGDRIFN